MNYFKKAFCFLFVLAAFGMTAMAQTAGTTGPYTPTQTIDDPKQLFVKHKLMVKLHIKGGMTQDVQLIYNDDTNLYYRIQDVPAVVYRPFSEIEKIEYPDGAVEFVYEDTFDVIITGDSSDT